MLKQRVITAVIMLAVLYAGTAWLPLAWFAGFLTLILLPALYEWGKLMGLRHFQHQATWFALFGSCLLLTLTALRLPVMQQDDVRINGAVVTPGYEPLSVNGIVIIAALAVVYWLWVFWTIRSYPGGSRRWQARWKIGLMGIACLIPSWVGLVYLKMLNASGMLVLILVAMVSIVDIGAFFSGSIWGKKEGRRPLAPALSPKKTWAGLWGGLISCTLFTWGILAWVHLHYRELSASVWALLMMISLLLAVYSVVGDLFESMLKRHRGIKDSGRTLPGHGGILDRIDSLLAATPVFVLGIALLSRVLEVI